MESFQESEGGRSSLNVTSSLNQEVERSERRAKEGLLKSPLRDVKFKTPSEQSNVFLWSRFYISLYYNKVIVNTFGFISGWKWYDRIDDYIILGALPTPSQIESLKTDERVDTVVNLCAEFPGYEKLYHDLNITQLRLETPDFTIPELATLQRGITHIVSIIQENPTSSIYVHCKAGRGRSAALTLAYLSRVYQLSLDESQAILLEKRPQANTNLFKSDQLRAFFKDILADVESGQYQRIPFYEPMRNNER